MFPIAAIVPATPVHLDINWPVLLTLAPLACYMCGALGLTFGTRFDPRTVPMLFGIVVLPLTFLGAHLLLVVVARPDPVAPDRRARATRSCTCARASGRRSRRVPHMSLWAIYPVMIGFSVLFTWLGISGFKRRVLS